MAEYDGKALYAAEYLIENSLLGLWTRHACPSAGEHFIRNSLKDHGKREAERFDRELI